MSSNYNEAFLNTKILINHFRELCEDFLPPYKVDNVLINRRRAKSNQDILYFLKQMERLINERKCDAQTFKSGVCEIKNLDILHIEILWYLEIAKLITLRELLQYHEENDNQDVIRHINQKVYENILIHKTQQSTVRKEMLIDYIKTMFSDLKTNYKTGETLLNLITSNLNQSFMCSDVLTETINFSTVIELLNNANFDAKCIKTFCYKVLNLLLEGSIQSMHIVFKKQEKVKNNFRTTKLFNFLKDLLKFCDLNELIELLKSQIFEKFESINWDYMLQFISALGIYYKDGWSMLKTLCNLLIKESITCKCSKLLSCAFIIARQGCFEKVNNSFPSYVQWFSSNFSSESKRPLNSKQTCTFFFNFLTDLVPYDAPYYLKVHINRSPWVPMDCQSFISEYIALVKTRLLDLNMSTELGICDNTSDKSAAVFDVENVLEYFGRTNEIMNSVFQASMFCKEYFEKKFLVELLSKFEGKKSVRHKFIIKLQSMGKVPSSMFKNYKSLEKKK